MYDVDAHQLFRFHLFFSLDTGQISDILLMPDFVDRFAQCNGGSCRFSNVRSGLIVSLLSIGTLFGALLGAPYVDTACRHVLTAPDSDMFYSWDVALPIILVVVRPCPSNVWSSALGYVFCNPFVCSLGLSSSVPKVVIQMASFSAWYQFAIGRLIAGFGVGALSVCHSHH